MATKILKDGLTNKQRILRMVERWDDDVSFDQALYNLYSLKEIVEAIEEADQCPDEGKDHDELFDELERLCDEEENTASMEAKSRKRPKGTPSSHRGGRNAKSGQGVRKAPKKTRESAS